MITTKKDLCKHLAWLKKEKAEFIKIFNGNIKITKKKIKDLK